MTRATGTTALRIRAATLSDIAQLAILAGQLGYPSTPEEIERRFRDAQKNPEQAIFVAEHTSSDLAGWIHVFVMRSLEANFRAEVDGLVVHERFRSQGVGPRLLERAEEWARERGCREIGLRANVIRERAHAFYERQGYRMVKTQKVFRKTL